MNTPAGWYPDSERPGQLRYWNGVAWTEQWAPDTGQSQAQPPGNASASAKNRGKTWLIVAIVLVVAAVAAVAAVGVVGVWYVLDMAHDSTHPAPARTPSASAVIEYRGATDLANPAQSTGTTVDATDVEAMVPEVVSAVNAVDVKAQVAGQLGLSRAELDRYAITASAEKTANGSASGRIRITVSGSNSATAVKITDAVAAAFVEKRKAAEKARIEKAAALLRDQVKQYQGADKQSSGYLLLQQRLQDLQILSATATGDFLVVAPASPGVD